MTITRREICLFLPGLFPAAAVLDAFSAEDNSEVPQMSLPPATTSSPSFVGVVEPCIAGLPMSALSSGSSRLDRRPRRNLQSRPRACVVACADQRRSYMSPRLVKLSAVLITVLCTVSVLAQMPNPYGPPVSVGERQESRGCGAGRGTDKQLEDGGGRG